MPIQDAWTFKILLISAFFIASAILIAFAMADAIIDDTNKFNIGLCVVLVICGLAISVDAIFVSSPFLLDGKRYDTEKIVEDNNLKIEHRIYQEGLNEESWVLKSEHKGYLLENGIEPGIIYVVEWQSGYGNKIIKAFVYEDEDSMPDPRVNDYLDYKYKDNTVSGND